MNIDNQDIITDIKHRLGIAEVVRSYVTLRGGSGATLRGLCPFHEDSNPSLIVNEKKGIAWCFSCSTGGDIFGFVQRIEGISFPESVRLLADRAGISPEKIEGFRKKTPEEKSEEDRMRAALVASHEFFVSQLVASAEAQVMLKERGYAPAIVKQFGLGYAPAGNALTSHLSAEGFARADIEKAGLATPGAGGQTRDLFRNRLMFPIADHAGNLVGFSGRAMGESNPKYVNSPATPLFKKSELLFGLDQCQQHLRKSGALILVEGFFDVMAFHAEGLPFAAAACGTAFTDLHAKRLRFGAGELVLCFDADSAGQSAAGRALAALLRAGVQKISALQLPSGEDPDSLRRENPGALQQAFDARVDAQEHFLAAAAARAAGGSLAAKQAAMAAGFPLIAAEKSPVAREHRLGQFAALIGTSTEALAQEFGGFMRNHSPDVSPKKAPAQSQGSSANHRPPTGLRYAAGLLLAFPTLADLFRQELKTDLLPSGDPLRPIFLGEEVAPEIKEQCDILETFAADYAGKLSAEGQAAEVKKAIQMANAELKKAKKDDLLQQLQSAESDNEQANILKDIADLG